MKINSDLSLYILISILHTGAMNNDLIRFVVENLQADSVGSVIIRAIIWLILVTIIAWGTAKGKEASRIKSEAGFFLLFIALTALAIYVAFGFIPTVTSIEEEASIIPFMLPLATLVARGMYQWQSIASYVPQT